MYLRAMGLSVVVFLLAVVSGCGASSGELSPGELLYKCNRDQSWACHNLGWSYQQGDGVAKDQEKANEYFLKACELGERTSCRNMGNSYVRGRGVDRDREKAAEFYRKACLGGDATSCRQLSIAYRLGKGLNENPTAAELYGEKACAGGMQQSCWDLYVFHCDGSQACAKRSPDLESTQAACAGGEENACSVLALMELRGDGVERDIAHGRASLSALCDDRDEFACTLLKREKKKLEESESKEALCGYGFYEHCYWLLTQEERALSKDDPWVQKLEAGCTSGEGEACYRLGILYQDQLFGGEPQEAIEYYRKACDLGVCSKVLWLVKAIEGGEVASCDIGEKLCEKKPEAFCYEKARCLFRGVRGEKNPEAAIEYSRKFL